MEVHVHVFGAAVSIQQVVSTLLVNPRFLISPSYPGSLSLSYLALNLE